MRDLALYSLCCLYMFISCSDAEQIGSNAELLKNPHNLSVDTFFIHSSDQFYQSNATFSLWMLKGNHIANWKSSYPFDLLEPINIIWIDYVSKTRNEAIKTIYDFLEQNDFSTRGFSSAGYHTMINNNEIIQSPEDKVWSDKANPFAENNHGRVFISENVGMDPAHPVFYSCGSFSRESEIDHYFISFNEGRDVLEPKGNWQEEDILLLDNIHCPTTSPEDWMDLRFEYSTMDHDGSRIFALYP